MRKNTDAERSDDNENALDGRHRRGAKARAAVLAQAMQMASVQGLEGLTIGALASELAISKGNITVLFGDKQALQLRTLDAAVEVFVSHVIAPYVTIRSPIERLKRYCDGWFDYVEKRVFAGGCFLFATSNEYRARPGPIQDRVKEHRCAWCTLLTTTARDAMIEGEIAADVDIDQMIFELIAFQSAANTALLLGDNEQFLRARRTSQNRSTVAGVHKPTIKNGNRNIR